MTGGENATNLVDVLIDAMHRREGEAMFGVPLMVMLDRDQPTPARSSKPVQGVADPRPDQQAEEPAREGPGRKGPGHHRARFRIHPAAAAVRQGRQPGEDQCAGGTLAPVLQRHPDPHAHGANPRLCLAAYHARTIGDPPAAELLRSLALSAPESRVVSTHLRVSYHGSDYDVSSVPGVCVGEKLLVCENPWAQDTVQVVMSDDEATRPTRSCNVSPMTNSVWSQMRP